MIESIDATLDRIASQPPETPIESASLTALIIFGLVVMWLGIK